MGLIVGRLALCLELVLEAFHEPELWQIIDIRESAFSSGPGIECCSFTLA